MTHWGRRRTISSPIDRGEKAKKVAESGVLLAACGLGAG